MLFWLYLAVCLPVLSMGTETDKISLNQSANLTIDKNECYYEASFDYDEEIKKLNVHEPYFEDESFVSFELKALKLNNEKIIEDNSVSVRPHALITNLDRRKKIINQSEYPWSMIGNIFTHFMTDYGQARVYRSTGILIGKKFVLTAAHCIYDRQYGCPIKIEFCSGDERSFVSRLMIDPLYFKGEEKDQEKHDLGLLMLEKSLGIYLGFTNIAICSDKEFPMNVIIAGYPGERHYDGIMAYADGDVFSSDASTLCYKIDTSPGQSGAPVLSWKEKNPIIIGVHTRGQPMEENYGVRINDDNLALIQNWVRKLKKFKKNKENEKEELNYLGKSVLSTSKINSLVLVGFRPCKNFPDQYYYETDDLELTEKFKKISQDNIESTESSIGNRHGDFHFDAVDLKTLQYIKEKIKKRNRILSRITKKETNRYSMS